MKEDMFKELLESVRQAGAIKRGEMEPSRVFVVDAPDVKAIRAKLGVSRDEFASLLGISVRNARKLGAKASDTKRTGPGLAGDRRCPSGRSLGCGTACKKKP